MTCEECGKKIKSYPCKCGYGEATTKDKKPKREWIIQSCSTPGCFTVIRSLMGKQEQVPVCKWCVDGTSHAALGHPAVDVRMRQS